MVLPPADCYNHPNKGYGVDKKRTYKELKHSKESYKRFRVKILQRQDFRCAYCSCDLKGRRMNIEHITPIARGGTNDKNNLVGSCGNCNKDKGNRILSNAEKAKLKQNLKHHKKQAKKHNRQYAAYVQEDVLRALELKSLFRED